MKKTINIQNNMIKNVIDALNIFKSRNNITCTPTITITVIRNIKILEEEMQNIIECEKTIKDKYFTDKTSHVEKDENGNEKVVLNKECEEEILKKITSDFVELGNGIAELELETISQKDFDKLIAKNKSLDVMTPLEISFLNLIIEEE